MGDARVATSSFSDAVNRSETNPEVSPVPGVGSGIFGNYITGVGTSRQFSMALDALKTKTSVNGLSTPRVLSIHGKSARVQIGGQQGYRVTTVNDGVSQETIEFIDTASGGLIRSLPVEAAGTLRLMEVVLAYSADGKQLLMVRRERVGFLTPTPLYRLQSINLADGKVKKNPRDAEFRIRRERAIAFYHQRLYAEAIADLDVAIDMKPTIPLLHYLRGNSRAQAGQLDAAEKDIREALRLAPDYEAAKKFLVAIERARKRTQKN